MILYYIILYSIILYNIYIYGVASKFGYGSARGDPDVSIGLDHLRFGMDRGYGSACGFRVWIGALHFDSQPYMCVSIGTITKTWKANRLEPSLSGSTFRSQRIRQQFSTMFCNHKQLSSHKKMVVKTMAKAIWSNQFPSYPVEHGRFSSKSRTDRFRFSGLFVYP